METRAEASKDCINHLRVSRCLFYYSVLEENPTLTLEIINGLEFFAYEEEISLILKKVSFVG